MNIDWTQLITKDMKDADALAAGLATVKADLAQRNARCALLIVRLQDRIDTLGYGMDSGEATQEDEDEQAALIVDLKAWRNYKFSLSKVTKQFSWPAAPVWPIEP